MKWSLCSSCEIHKSRINFNVHVTQTLLLTKNSGDKVTTQELIDMFILLYKVVIILLHVYISFTWNVIVMWIYMSMPLWGEWMQNIP